MPSVRVIKGSSSNTIRSASGSKKKRRRDAGGEGKAKLGGGRFRAFEGVGVETQQTQ